MNTQSGAISLYLSVKLLDQRNISKVLVNRKVASWSSFIGQAVRHGISFWISSIQSVHMGTWKIGIQQHFPVVTSISDYFTGLFLRNLATLQQAKLLWIKPTYREMWISRQFNSPDCHFLAYLLNQVCQPWFLSLQAFSCATAPGLILFTS